jgi:hypothetical protein
MNEFVARAPYSQLAYQTWEYGQQSKGDGPHHFRTATEGRHNCVPCILASVVWSGALTLSHARSGA